MNIQILHIEDESDVVDNVKKNLDELEISGCRLQLVKSCGFQEGMETLRNDRYDLVILDLCVGNASAESDKVGEDVFHQIQQRAFIPVVFFTGLPGYVKSFKSDIVKVVGKADGYDELIEAIRQIIESGFLKIRQDVDDLTREGVRSFFWNFIHSKSSLIAKLQGDEISLKYLLLRRLAKSLSSDFLRESINDSGLKKEFAHPMEFYIFPPLDGEYEAGDIVRSKDGKLYITLTPSCDFVIRAKGNRNAEKIFLVHARPIESFSEFQRMKDLQKKLKDTEDAKKQIGKDDTNQLKSAESQVKQMMKPGWHERYFFLPPTPFIEASMIDFQNRTTVSYEQLEKEFEPLASLDDPIAQAVMTSYARYQSRIGYPDLDVDFVFGKL